MKNNNKLIEKCFYCDRVLTEDMVGVVKNINGVKEFCNIECWNKFQNKRIDNDSDWEKLRKGLKKKK